MNTTQQSPLHQGLFQGVKIDISQSPSEDHLAKYKAIVLNVNSRKLPFVACVEVTDKISQTTH